MNNNKTSSIISLAAAALLVAGCDPFPKAPGGTPEVIRAVASGPTSLNQLDGPFANPNTDIVLDDAVLNDTFYIWFNKALDGSTVQAAPDFDPGTGLANDNPCDPAGSPLTNTLPADAQLCYTSGSAAGGGIIELTPAPVIGDADPTNANFWPVGTYSVSGTVKDYQGAPLSFSATFNVTHNPVFVAPDPYTVDLGWARVPGTDDLTFDYTIERLAKATAPEAGDTWELITSTAKWVPPASGANNEIFRVTGGVPGTRYWFRIRPNGVLTADSTPGTVKLGAAPSVAARANPLSNAVPPAPLPGTVQLSTAGIRGATYRLEQAVVPAVPTDPPAPLVWETATGTITSAAGATLTNPFTLATRPLVVNVSGLTAGTTYRFRYVPIFGGVDNTPTAQSNAVTPN